VAGILALGVWDDFRDLRPMQKAAGQVVIAAMTWGLGFRVGGVELPFGWVVFFVPVLSFLITVGWIVVVTNAFNLIDGIDGLSAGVGIVAALTMVILAAENGATVPVIGALALAGSLAAFLRFNLPPARIFLGDAGAMGIGYTLAVLSVASSQKSPTAVVLIVPLLALGLPLLDTLLSIVRRVASGAESRGWEVLWPKELLRAVTSADRGHIHYLLLRSGWSLRAVLFVLYAFSIGLGALALVTREADSTVRWSVLTLLVLSGFVVLRLLERRVARRGATGTADEPDVLSGEELPRQDPAAG
jgi:UDP-GlcNAc:undecaprenyl-phosphate GlcNAc-1-phosphate transferase